MSSESVGNQKRERKKWDRKNLTELEAYQGGEHKGEDWSAGGHMED
jgi:hypothetical protein